MWFSTCEISFEILWLETYVWFGQRGHFAQRCSSMRCMSFRVRRVHLISRCLPARYTNAARKINASPLFSFQGRFWEVRHRYIDIVKVCFLGNLYQHTSGLSNWLWKHCYSPAWHLCISVLSVLWVSVNSFFQLHVGQGTNPIILMLGKWGQTSNHSPAHTMTGDGWEKILQRLTKMTPADSKHKKLPYIYCILKNLIVFIQ